MTNQVLFFRSLQALAVGSVLVVLAYFFVDRQAAEFVRRLELERVELTDQSLDSLRAAGVPEGVLARLSPLKGKAFAMREVFSKELAGVLDKDELARYRQPVMGNLLEPYRAVTTTLKGMTTIPEWLQVAVPVILVLAGVRLTWGPLSRCEWVVFVAALSLLVGVCFKDHLKNAFGRPWPTTWIGKPPSNPSLLGDAEGKYAGAYGFFFKPGDKAPPKSYESFPSGHTFRIVAFVAVFWVTFPRIRWLCALAAVLVGVGLVGMNYHFVGDVIGGAVLGGITGAYAARFAGLSGRGAFAQSDRV